MASKGNDLAGQQEAFAPHRVGDVFNVPATAPAASLLTGQDDAQWLVRIGTVLLLTNIAFAYQDQRDLAHPWFDLSVIGLLLILGFIWLSPRLPINHRHDALYYGGGITLFSLVSFGAIISSDFSDPHLFSLYLLAIFAGVYYGGLRWGAAVGLGTGLLGLLTVVVVGSRFDLVACLAYLLILWCLGGFYALLTARHQISRDQLVARLAEERRLRDQLGSISSAARSLAASFSLDDLFAEVARSATNLLAVDHAVLKLCDYEQETQRTRTIYASDPALQQRLTYLLDELDLGLYEGLSGWVVQYNRPLAVTRAADHPRFVPLAAAPEMGEWAMLHVPLTIKGQVIGVLGLSNTHPRRFSEDDVDLLTSFAGQVAVAIENARLLSETKAQQGRLERSREGLTAVLKINQTILTQRGYMATLEAIVGNLTTLVPFTNCVVYNIVADNTMMEAVLAEGSEVEALARERFSINEGIVGLVARQGHGELVNHAELDLRSAVVPGVSPDDPWSLLVVPFLTKEGVVSGVIRLGRAGDWQFEQDELELLDIFAAQATLALESARLYTEVASQKQTLEYELREQDLLFQVSNLTVTAGVVGDRRGELDYGWLRNCLNLIHDELAAEASVILFGPQHELVATTEGFSRQGQELLRRYVAEGEPFNGGEADLLKSWIDFAGLAEALRHTDRVASLHCVPLLARNQLIGTMVVFTRRQATAELQQPNGHNDPASGQQDQTVLRSMANVIAGGVETMRSYHNLRETYFQTTQMLVEIMENKDPYTRGHSQRVSGYSVEIGEVLLRQGRLTREEVETLRRAALLHDIGKLGIHDDLLHLKGRLGVEGFWIIASHTYRGANILSKIDMLKPLAPLVKAHHERFDGLGYPDGLMRDEIPFLSRIVSVADSFDAMTTTRDYQKARSWEWAIEELIRNKGTQFDPEIVDVFVPIIREELRNGEVSIPQLAPARQTVTSR